jgi:methanogenic corrinoid protein MtbC1
VPADTFRAWERRYGVPQPQRTEGGHRLYSDHDIAVIRWLRDRTAEGMNISQAVQLLKSAAEENDTEDRDARAIERLSEELVEALASFDTPQAERLLGEAFGLYPFEDVLLDLVQPVMVEIGECWHRGEINVAAEHFATQFVRRKLAGLLNIFDGIPHRATLIVGCGPNELHDLGTLLIALFLSRRGWNVVYLGAQVPVADLIETAQKLRPALVCLSASRKETAIQLAEVARSLLEAVPNVLFGYGGRAFNIHPEMRAAMPGDFLGNDARELSDRIAALLRRGPTSTITERA